MKRTLSRREAEYLRQGALILGCGGGGDPMEGVELIERIYEAGRAITLADFEDLLDEDIVATIGYVGGGVSPDELDAVANYVKEGDAVLRAAEELSKLLGEEIAAFMPVEPGAGNSFVAMYAAAMTGAVTMDADTAGRAKPEIVNSTTSIFEIPLTPLVIVTDYGDVMVLKEAVDERRVERLSRYVARASGGLCAVARCPVRVKRLKGKVIEGSMGLALAAGRAICEEKRPVEALIKVLEGQRLFEGEISSFSRREEGGFMWGEIELIGVGSFKGETYKIWFKNENLVGWRNGKVDVTCPDLIALVDAYSGVGTYNWDDKDFFEGHRCVVIGREADPIWLTPRGLELFGPRHFGFDFDYRPFRRQGGNLCTG